jgi:hypothetical protein
VDLLQVKQILAFVYRVQLIQSHGALDELAESARIDFVSNFFRKFFLCLQAVVFPQRSDEDRQCILVHVSKFGEK